MKHHSGSRISRGSISDTQCSKGFSGHWEMCVYTCLYFFFQYYFWDKGISTSSSFFKDSKVFYSNYLLISSKDSQQNDVIIFFGTFPFPCLSSSVSLCQKHPHPHPFSTQTLHFQVSGNSLSGGYDIGHQSYFYSTRSCKPFLRSSCLSLHSYDPQPQTCDNFKCHIQNGKSQPSTVLPRLIRRHCSAPWLACVQSALGNEWEFCLLRYCLSPSFIQCLIYETQLDCLSPQSFTSLASLLLVLVCNVTVLAHHHSLRSTLTSLSECSGSGECLPLSHGCNASFPSPRKNPCLLTERLCSYELHSNYFCSTLV